jgi:hypothetical protein
MRDGGGLGRDSVLLDPDPKMTDTIPYLRRADHPVFPERRGGRQRAPFESIGTSLLCRAIRVLPLVFLVTVLSMDSARGADEEPPPAIRATEGPCMGEEGHGRTWMDRTHAYLNRTLCQPAAWFDGFFGEERPYEEGYPGTSARLQFGVRWSEDEDYTYPNQFNISMRLPHATRKLRLIVAGKSEGDPTQILPDDPLDTGLEEDEDEREGKVELRYDARERRRSKFSVGLGMRFDLPLPPPYVRLRYRYTFPLSVNSLARLVQTGFWEEEEGFGGTTRIDLERRFGEPVLVRWSSAGNYSESIEGIEWGSRFSLFRKLSSKKAVTYATGLSGVTKPRCLVEQFEADVRYRKNFFRPWLFYELVPEIRWPRDETGSYRPVWGVTVLLEIQFNS